MPKTIQDIISDARVILQDTGDVLEVRNSDEDLLRWLNNGLLEIRRLRPDFFLGSYSTAVPTYTISDLGDTYPYDEQTTTALTYFIAGSSELKDNEHVTDGRAIALINQFKQLLLTAG